MHFLNSSEERVQAFAKKLELGHFSVKLQGPTALISESLVWLTNQQFKGQIMTWFMCQRA